VEKLEVRLGLELVLAETNHHFLRSYVSPSAVLLVVLLPLRQALPSPSSALVDFLRLHQVLVLLVAVVVVVVVAVLGCGAVVNVVSSRRRLDIRISAL
jgi:type III secretory pathway component EscU